MRGPVDRLGSAGDVVTADAELPRARTDLAAHPCPLEDARDRDARGAARATRVDEVEIDVVIDARLSNRPIQGNWNAVSGHQSAPSSVFGFDPLIDSGMSIVAPLATDTFPHQAHPFVGS